MRFRQTILLPLLAVVGACAVADSTQPSVPATETFASSLGVDLTTFTEIPPLTGNLFYKDILVGTGAIAKQSDSITVAYSGYLKDGTLFDGQTSFGPFSLNQVITGWTLGIPGMRVGGKRKLVIGSSYAYGAPGRGSIPPHATLIFDIELKALK